VGVNYQCKTSVGLFNVFIHLLKLTWLKVLRVEDEILVSIRPLNVHPKHINRESIIGEVFISFNDHISRNICPLAEVEAQSMILRQRNITADNSQVFLNLFKPVERSAI
jgi:hypothetical protein